MFVNLAKYRLPRRGAKRRQPALRTLWQRLAWDSGIKEADWETPDDVPRSQTCSSEVHAHEWCGPGLLSEHLSEEKWEPIVARDGYDAYEERKQKRKKLARAKQRHFARQQYKDPTYANYHRLKRRKEGARIRRAREIWKGEK